MVMKAQIGVIKRVQAFHFLKCHSLFQDLAKKSKVATLGNQGHFLYDTI